MDINQISINSLPVQDHAVTVRLNINDDFRFFPIVPSSNFMDWHGLRNESYLNVIYGANGLYHWMIGQKHQIQRLRGWFQELNHMWPVFVADDADNKVEKLFELPGTMSLEGGDIHDVWKKYDVHVYRITDMKN